MHLLTLSHLLDRLQRHILEYNVLERAGLNLELFDLRKWLREMHSNLIHPVDAAPKIVRRKQFISLHVYRDDTEVIR